MNSRLPPADACPCGSGLSYPACCGPYLSGFALPDDAEALMRSRYTAYVRQDEAYLLATWHPDTRPERLGLADEAPVKWLGLTVKRHERQDPDQAVVEFVARYKIAGRAFRMHETSRFVREAQHWYYVTGNTA